MNMSELEKTLGIDTLMIIHDGDQEYRVASVKIKHLSAVQSRSLEMYRKESIETLRQAKELLTPDDMRLTVQEILDRQGNWTLEMLSPRGVQYFAYLLLKENHPDITEEIAGSIMGMKELEEIGRVIGDALGIKLDEEGEADTVPLEAQSDQ
jgi:F420-0:gamma-glutamyl ligase-like protein